MKYYVECELRDFEAWSGGARTIEHLTPAELDDIEELMDAHFGHIPKENEINDFLWFERDEIAQYLEYEDWDDLLESKRVK